MSLSFQISESHIFGSLTSYRQFLPTIHPITHLIIRFLNENHIIKAWTMGPPIL